MPRLMTYNVHRCVGVDRRLDVARIAEVITQCRPDVVCLQELDVLRRRTGHVDQAHAIAHRLEMSFHFHPAFNVEEELYGDAVLSTAPLELVRAAALPGSPTLKGLEPRGALWVRAAFGGRAVNVMNTHFGLVPHEQRAQAEALLGPDWLGAWDGREPLLAAGDFNATPRYAAYRALAARLPEARDLVRPPCVARTYPSRLPMLAIDHVFAGGPVRIRRVFTPDLPLARVASDHLPLIVDFEV